MRDEPEIVRRAREIRERQKAELPDLDKILIPPGECPGGPGILHHPNCQHSKEGE